MGWLLGQDPAKIKDKGVRKTLEEFQSLFPGYYENGTLIKPGNEQFDYRKIRDLDGGNYVQEKMGEWASRKKPLTLETGVLNLANTNIGFVPNENGGYDMTQYDNYDYKISPPN